MYLSTVSSIVEALVATYTAGLQYYTKWQQRKRQHNHYRTDGKANAYVSNVDALSASLKFSSRKIKEAFDSGADILGDGFSIGDEACHEALREGLEYLQEHIYALYEATRTEGGLLELQGTVHVSEHVRISCLASLADQYRRVAVGRLLPQALSGSQPQRPRLSLTIFEEDVAEPANDDVSDGSVGAEDARTVGASSSSKSSYLQPEPPSPPLTPKLISTS
ncbi:hypothetical protein GGR52DRAFT_555053 [Hypoxylon sp. FL1284]|nr:hypothetical protein GGR52DRAFT_555053 [Hypoxylon sp. FL1284]